MSDTINLTFVYIYYIHLGALLSGRWNTYCPMYVCRSPCINWSSCLYLCSHCEAHSTEWVLNLCGVHGRNIVAVHGRFVYSCCVVWVMEAVCLVVGCIKLCWLSIVYVIPQTTLYVKRVLHKHTLESWGEGERGVWWPQTVLWGLAEHSVYSHSLGGYCGTFPNSDSSF